MMLKRVAAFPVGSCLYRKNCNDIDLIVVVDDERMKSLNVDVKIKTKEEMRTMSEMKRFSYTVTWIVDRYLLRQIRLTKHTKNYIFSCVDKAYVENALAEADIKAKAAFGKTMLFALKHFRRFKKKDFETIRKIYDGDESVYYDILSKFVKLIEKKRSRSIGYWCFDEDSKYRKLSKEKYEEAKKKHSNLIDVNGMFVWLSDDAKHDFERANASHNKQLQTCKSRQQ